MGHAAALTIGLFLAQGTDPAPEKLEALAPPPARAPIGALAGFESRSTIEFETQPGRPHELRAAYVFPGRTRWWISSGAGADAERRLRYRYGRHVFALEPRRTESVEYGAEDRDALLRAFELRQALFTWPGDREWTQEDAASTQAVGDLGRLRAKLAVEEPRRPVELALIAPDGTVAETLRAITWRREGERFWPAAFELWNGETLVWRETVDAVDVETRYIDSFFVPPDRRGVQGSATTSTRALDIPPVCLRRVALPANTTWEAAVARRRDLYAEWKHAAEHPLESWATFELKPDGSPAAVLLRIARAAPRPPDGFTLLPERTGVATSVRGLAQVDGKVAHLRRSLPAGTRAGAAYVRFAPDAADGDVVVVLPCE